MYSNSDQYRLIKLINFIHLTTLILQSNLPIADTQLDRTYILCFVTAQKM